ncbi:MAG: endonuclease/exonuclease/phosphatase family protein [Clostridium sp.]|nr:endonuclease/exonuclease/phosphatase family protein [Prevotella sp.]MCM1429551.1 endonuclease/exonuclease/phosphatase family protein [Clostridium sp.]MCM1476041.1 endonuclease/exonuclease/phosphatase family protein [Muribaculaceae bacterium]
MIIVSPILRLAAKIATFVIYVITIISAYGGWLDPHIFTLPSIMVLAFPYLAMITIALTAIWLLCKRFITGGIGVVTLLICWTPLSMTFPLNFSKSPKSNEKTFYIMSWNCLHLYDQKTGETTPRRSLEFLLNSNADIICCQELFLYDLKALEKAQKPLLDSVKKAYPYICSSEDRDQTVFSKYPVERIHLHVDQPVNKGNYSFYRVKIGNKFLTIASVHLFSFMLSPEERKVISDIRNTHSAEKSLREFRGPLKGKMGFAFIERSENTREVIEGLSQIKGPVIVCGDFNDVPASWIYRMFLKAGYKDAYTATNFCPTFTFNAHMMYFHLDQILYRGGLRPLRVDKNKIDSSDHYPLMAQFAFTNE